MKFSDSKTDFGIELTVTLGLEFGISVLGGGKMLAACVGLSSQAGSRSVRQNLFLFAVI